MLPQVHTPMIKIARQFRFLDRASEHSLSEAAYRFILGHPQVSTVIGGFSDAVQLDEAVRAANSGPLSTVDVGAIAELHQRGFGGAQA